MKKLKLSPTGAAMLLALISCIWGSGFVVSQICYDEGITPVQLIAGRFIAASLLMDIIFFKIIIKLDRGTVASGSVIGIFLLFGFVFQNYGLMMSTPSVCAFITSIYVVMIPIISWLVYKRRPRLRVMTACAMAMIGVILFTVTDSLEISIGGLLTFVAAFFYALQVLGTERFTRIHSPLALTIVTINFTALSSTLVAIVGVAVSGNPLVLTLNGLSALVYLGVFCTAICFLGQNIGQKFTSASKAGIILSTESIFGALFSIGMLGEKFTLRMFIGAVIIFMAVIISETNIYIKKPTIKNIFKSY